MDKQVEWDSWMESCKLMAKMMNMLYDLKLNLPKSYERQNMMEKLVHRMHQARYNDNQGSQVEDSNTCNNKELL